MVRNVLQAIVRADHDQHAFGLAEREAEKLLDQEHDQDCPLVIYWPTDLVGPLPEREVIGTETNGLHDQAQTVDRNIVVSIEIDYKLIELDEVGFEVRLSSKIEKVVRYLYDRGC